MLFRKRNTPPPAARQDTDVPSQQLYRIDFDMMLKGSIYKRRKDTVRQFGVTVNGATRLVTSGDLVDSPTYAALLAAGAIRPAAGGSGPRPEAHAESADSADLEE